MTEVRPRDVSVTPRALVIGCVMASMTMVALEMTIVSTAMLQIGAQLGGLSLYSWVFSPFVLTQTAMWVVFGKLADVHGRQPVMLVGIEELTPEDLRQRDGSLADHRVAGARYSERSLAAERLT